MPQRKGEQRRRHTDEQIDRQTDGLIKKKYGVFFRAKRPLQFALQLNGLCIGKCIQGTGGGQGYVPILSNNIIKVVL